MNANRQPPPGAVFGAILVVIGLAVLATRYVPGLEDAAFWPFFIIGPGIVLFLLGLILPNVGMIIGGTVVTSVGLILAWQNATGLWATWAYVWALVGPGASGLGTFIGGLRTGNGRMARAGIWQMVIGIALFIGFYLFFEEVIGLTGNALPLAEWVFPAFLILLGVLVLIQGFVGRGGSDPWKAEVYWKDGRHHHGDPPPVEPLPPAEAATAAEPVAPAEPAPEPPSTPPAEPGASG